MTPLRHACVWKAKTPSTYSQKQMSCNVLLLTREKTSLHTCQHASITHDQEPRTSHPSPSLPTITLSSQPISARDPYRSPVSISTFSTASSFKSLSAMRSFTLVPFLSFPFLSFHSPLHPLAKAEPTFTEAPSIDSSAPSGTGSWPVTFQGHVLNLSCKSE